MIAAADIAVAPGSGADALSVRAARRALTEQFRAAGLDAPELDARILVGHALALDHAGLAAAGARVLDAAEWASIAAFAYRRLAREPVARIVGNKEFWSLTLRINATTLVPRPETETVVETALAAIDAGGSRSQPLRLADLGTGSGALLLALLTELPNAFGIGTDTSVGALRIARENAQRLQLARAAFVAGDMSAALRGPFDLIVSNPPYIASGDIAALAAEVRDYDPRSALDGGADGLDYYRAIAAVVPALLKPAGALVVEVGTGQARAVTALFAEAGLAASPPRMDLAGVPRALVARHRAATTLKTSRKGHDPAALVPRQKSGKKALGILTGTD
jgi:release factor glutamine methyltransferase